MGSLPAFQASHIYLSEEITQSHLYNTKINLKHKIIHAHTYVCVSVCPQIHWKKTHLKINKIFNLKKRYYITYY